MVGGHRIEESTKNKMSYQRKIPYFKHWTSVQNKDNKSQPNNHQLGNYNYDHNDKEKVIIVKNIKKVESLKIMLKMMSVEKQTM